MEITCRKKKKHMHMLSMQNNVSGLHQLLIIDTNNYM